MNIDILLAGFDASQIEQIGSIFWLAIHCPPIQSSCIYH